MPQNTVPGDGSDTRPSRPRVEPDAHGQAALLLAESILHALVEAETLSVAQALDVVRTAAAVKLEVADEIGESDGRMKQSLDLLAGMERSLGAGTDGG